MRSFPPRRREQVAQFRQARHHEIRRVIGLRGLCGGGLARQHQHTQRAGTMRHQHVRINPIADHRDLVGLETVPVENPAQLVLLSWVSPKWEPTYHGYSGWGGCEDKPGMVSGCSFLSRAISIKQSLCSSEA